MIFKELEKIEALSIKEREALIKRDSAKAPCSHKRRRSNMMLNPLNLKHLNRLDELSADMVTLNLEDGISPSKKEEALVNIALFLSHLKYSPSFIVVRVNPIKSTGVKEIKYLRGFGIDAIRIPKVKSKIDIKDALYLIEGTQELHISIETKEAYKNLATWGGLDKRLTTAILGILDLLTDMNLPHSLLKLNNPTIDTILTNFLIDAHIANLLPTSFMFQDYKDIDTFRAWCEKEKLIGFSSKSCLGPAQVEVANEIFNLSEEEIKRAKEIKEAFEKNAKEGINGFMHDRYGFIDEPIYKYAIKLLDGIELAG